MCACVSVDGLEDSQPGGWEWRGRSQRGKICFKYKLQKKEKKLERSGE